MKNRFIFSSILALLLGFGGGYIFFHNTKSTGVISEKCQGNYLYVNKQLDCKQKLVIKKYEYREFVQKLNQYIEEVKSKKEATNVSVYFRDLQYGPTFGINEKEKFAPASLLKLPLLFTYLNLAEDDTTLFSRDTSYDNVVSLVEQDSNKIPKLLPRTNYSIDDLLSRMIIYSDNLSYWLLIDYLRKNYPNENLQRETLEELGLVSPRSPLESTITVKSYSSLFRQLYNSSYLSLDMSERALALLVKSTYDLGLVAGVSKGTQVAHKFGELGGLPNNEKQLHDCGIIYYPDNPYLLCVMTRGDNFEELQTVIKTISEKIYQEVDSRKY